MPSEEAWNEARDYLDVMIDEYTKIPTGGLALIAVLFPLRKRFEMGERTLDLYQKMMGVE